MSLVQVSSPTANSFLSLTLQVHFPVLVFPNHTSVTTHHKHRVVFLFQTATQTSLPSANAPSLNTRLVATRVPFLFLASHRVVTLTGHSATGTLLSCFLLLANLTQTSFSSARAHVLLVVIAASSAMLLASLAITSLLFQIKTR